MGHRSVDSIMKTRNKILRDSTSHTPLIGGWESTRGRLGGGYCSDTELRSEVFFHVLNCLPVFLSDLEVVRSVSVSLIRKIRLGKGLPTIERLLPPVALQAVDTAWDHARGLGGSFLLSEAYEAVGDALEAFDNRRYPVTRFARMRAMSAAARVCSTRRRDVAGVACDVLESVVEFWSIDPVLYSEEFCGVVGRVTGRFVEEARQRILHILMSERGVV